MLDANQVKSLLNLQPHPAEGGYFRETYRSAEAAQKDCLPKRYSGARSFSTAIYYLLTPDTFSALHRLPTDEVYHFYLGDPIEMLQLYPDGSGQIITLGNDLLKGMQPQVVIPKGVWQGSRLIAGGEFALLGATMAPGFEFEDYEPGDRETLINLYPQHGDRIRSLTRVTKTVPFDLQPVLEGPLLRLRPLRPEDFDELYAVASDPLIWEQHPANDRYQEEVFREFFREALDSGGALIATDCKDGRVIGSSRFYGYDEGKSEIEIGWSFLARSHWGGIYNREMKELMLRHAFQFVKSVVFLVGPQNLRSQKAMEKIGGIRIGSRFNAYGRDSVVYQITSNAPLLAGDL